MTAMASSLFGVLCIAWAASEIWLGLRRRSGDVARLRDAGTLRLLLVTIYACIGLAVWAATLGIARYPQPLMYAFQWLGCTLMVGGIVLRWWAIRVLAQWFTVDVAIRPGHQLVRSEPYRRLRHPSYTGALLTFYGFAIALGNVMSLLVVVLPVTLAFLWRIRIEERVLAEAFGDEYTAYARNSKRLVPGVW